MSANNQDDTFLARWLNDELTAEELEEFKATDEYVVYSKILAGANLIRPTDFDQDKLRERIANARSAAKPKRKVRQLWAYGVAASIAILFAFFFYFNQPDTVKSEFGQQLAHTLPDGSQVLLNANSEIAVSESDWEDDRQLKLSGEAYFQVAKGEKFIVETKLGNVQVLGTQFNVLQMGELLEVVCYEGKVSVSAVGEEVILLPGRGVRVLGGQLSKIETAGSRPAWSEGESRFESMPAKYVLLALQNQFEIEVVNQEVVENVLFSGRFPHDDQSVALRIVFESLQVGYEVNGEKVYLEPK